MTSLLSPASFLEVMVQLVCTAKEEKEGIAGILDVQRRALEILAGKLADRKVHFLESHVRRQGFVMEMGGAEGGVWGKGGRVM